MDKNQAETLPVLRCQGGGRKDFEFGFEGYSVWCENCRSQSAVYDSPTDAIEAWNKRAQ